MKSNLLFGVFALVIFGSFGQVIFDHTCPTNPVVVKGFDLGKYLGLWYEISRYEQYYDRDGECSQAFLSLNDDGSVHVFNTMIRPASKERGAGGGPGGAGAGGAGGADGAAHVKAVISFPDVSPLEGKLNVTFNPLQPSVSNYWILDTDYKHYAIINSCRKVGDDWAEETAWILSRTPQLDESVQSHVDKVIDLYLSRENLRITKQDAESCNYTNSTST